MEDLFGEIERIVPISPDDSHFCLPVLEIIIFLKERPCSFLISMERSMRGPGGRGGPLSSVADAP